MSESFDPFTPVLDPYTPLKEAASRCPVVPAPNGAVVVTGAANVAAVFKDSASFRNELRPPKPGTQPSLVHLDGDEHTRMRKLVVKAFTPRAVKNLEDPTYAIAHGLVDQFIGRGTTDLCTEFAFLLPAMVIAELVGIPEGDRSQFVQWADDAITAAGPELQRLCRIRSRLTRLRAENHRPAPQHAGRGLAQRFDPSARRRRSAPH